MSKPTGKQVAEEAISLLKSPTIIYYNNAKRAEFAAKEKDLNKRKIILSSPTADCQGFVEKVIWNCGASKKEMPDYRGSNDMFRNACSWTGTIAEAKRLGYLVPGAVLFIVDHNGGEPSSYKGDGLGNASHIGFYLGEPGFYDTWLHKQCNAAHSSASRGRACGSTLKNAWTHVGLLKAVDYGKSSIANTGAATPAKEAKIMLTEEYTVPMYVHVESGNDVNMRVGPAVSKSLVARVPKGEQVFVIAGDGLETDTAGNTWRRINWGKYYGYMMTKFLAESPVAAGAVGAMSGVAPVATATDLTGLTDAKRKAMIQAALTQLAQAEQLLKSLL